jgi:hypothetical protein
MAARGIIGTASMRTPSPSKRSSHHSTSLVTVDATSSLVQSRLGRYDVNQHAVSSVAHVQLPTPQTHVPLDVLEPSRRLVARSSTGAACARGGAPRRR